MADYVRAKTTVTVPLKDGSRHEVINAGTVCKTSDFQDYFQAALEDDDSYTSSLFEKASKSDYDEQGSAAPEGVEGAPLTSVSSGGSASEVEQITDHETLAAAGMQSPTGDHPSPEGEGGGSKRSSRRSSGSAGSSRVGASGGGEKKE